MFLVSFRKTIFSLTVVCFVAIMTGQDSTETETPIDNSYWVTQKSADVLIIPWNRDAEGDLTSISKTVDLRNYFDVDKTVARFTMDDDDYFDVELYRDIAPFTVSNFLDYVEDGVYNSTFFHRSVSDSVSFLQGGGYYATIPVVPVGQIRTLLNNPIESNTTGTIAMAKYSDNENSATNQWFFNMADNTSFDGDVENPVNGGYTVFGKVLRDGVEDVLKKIEALTVWDLTEDNESSPFGYVPLRDRFTGAGRVTADDLVTIESIEWLFKFPGTAETQMGAILSFTSDQSVSKPSIITNSVLNADLSEVVLTVDRTKNGESTAYVTATDLVGNSETAEIKVSVEDTHPRIISWPVSRVARAGDTVVLSVEAKAQNATEFESNSDVFNDAKIDSAWYFAWPNGNDSVDGEVLFGSEDELGVESTLVYEIPAALSDIPTAPSDIPVDATVGSTLPIFCDVVTGHNRPTREETLVDVEIVEDYARLVGMESRSYVGLGHNLGYGEDLVAGFSLTSEAAENVIVKSILVRGVVDDGVVDPGLEVYKGITWLGENRDWIETTALTTAIDNISIDGVESFFEGSSDAAYLLDATTAAAGAVNSAYLYGEDGANVSKMGFGTIQVYDADDVDYGADSDSSTWPETRISNLSVRGKVTVDYPKLNLEFVVMGEGKKINLLIRGVGTSLETISNDFSREVLIADPRIKLFKEGVEVAISENDNWIDSRNKSNIEAITARAGAFDLYEEVPSLETDVDSTLGKDAALFVVLEEGTYTIELSDADVEGIGGIGLIEIYEVR